MAMLELTFSKPNPALLVHVLDAVWRIDDDCKPVNANGKLRLYCDDCKLEYIVKELRTEFKDRLVIER